MSFICIFSLIKKRTLTRCKVLPCNPDKRGSTSTYFFDSLTRCKVGSLSDYSSS
uniref:Similarity n=1 Tax=Microcystis aeruginosa (strain PCC 7806) TaxID=267872 RepID=A8YIT6_MICA7|nr:unnamed protein product [Microcystis aeruginosa PCC 7806]